MFPLCRILKNGGNYPGVHNQSTQRTSPNLKPLQPKAQMLIIWKSLCEYLSNNIRAGRSVNIKKFGAFTFDMTTELPKIATRCISPKVDLATVRMERKNVHHLKPVFVVDPAIQMHLTRYAGKEEITPAISQHSIYQKGFRGIYANPVPIASGACLGKEVIVSALNTIWLAIVDLIKYGRDIDLAFGFANVRITGRNLKTCFLPELSRTIGAAEFEDQMVRQKSPVSTLWKTSYADTFARSTLGTLVKKPNYQVTQTLDEKTAALKIMSLDMSSSGRNFYKA